MLKLMGFKQLSNSEFLFQFDKMLSECFLIVKTQVPHEIDINNLAFTEGKLRFQANEKSLKITLPDQNFYNDGEHSVIILMRTTSILKKFLHGINFFKKLKFEEMQWYYFELVRQPAGWLKHEFNYDRGEGYSILGRRNIDIGGKNLVNIESNINFNDVPDLTALEKIDDKLISIFPKEIPELQIAGNILQLLWSGNVNDAPTDLSYSDFIQLSFEEKLRQIHEGQYPVSCQGMRDMFLHAALSFPGLKVRAVNAFNYAPQFENLISYSHATAEIYVEYLGKWVLTDPWFGFVLSDQNNVYMSAEDILGYRGKFEINPLVEQIMHSHLGSFGEIASIIRRPTEEKLNIYTITRSGHIPSFDLYFNKLDYGYAKCLAH